MIPIESVADASIEQRSRRTIRSNDSRVGQIDRVLHFLSRVDGERVTRPRKHALDAAQDGLIDAKVNRCLSNQVNDDRCIAIESYLSLMHDLQAQVLFSLA